MAVAEESKFVVGSRHLPSVRRPEKRMESSGVAVGFEQQAVGVVTVQSLARAVEDMKTKANAGVAAVGNSPEQVYSWVVGRLESCRRGCGCGSKVCKKQ